MNEKRRVWEQIALAFGNPMEPQATGSAEWFFALAGKKRVEGLGGQEMVPFVAPELMFYAQHVHRVLESQIHKLVLVGGSSLEGNNPVIHKGFIGKH